MEARRTLSWGLACAALALLLATPAVAQVDEGDGIPVAAPGKVEAVALERGAPTEGVLATTHQYDNTTAAAIADAGCPTMVESTISVADTYTVGVVRVGVLINHAWRGDLHLQLVSPTGTVVRLLWEQGGSADHVNVLWNDLAASTIGTGNHALTPPYYLTYRPLDPLGALRGESVTGDWKLQVCDFSAGTAGTLTQWSLFVDTGLVIQPTALSSVGCHGDWKTYNLDVVNATGGTTMVALSYASSLGWTIVAPASTGTLDDGDMETVRVDVKIPNDATANATDVTTVTGTGGSDTAAATLTTRCQPFGAWQGFADLTTARGTRGHSLVYWDGKIYKIGGYDGVSGASVNWLDIYDVDTDTWTSGTNMTTAVRWVDCVPYDLPADDPDVGPQIYCAGGYTTTQTNIFQIYNIGTGLWSAGPTLGTARYGYGGAIHNGVYYIAGGATSAGSVGTGEYIDLKAATPTWTALPAMGTAHREPAAGVIAGKLYVACGSSSGQTTPTTAMDVLDLSLIGTPGWAWTTGTAFPLSPGWLRMADGVMNDRYLMMVGGYFTSSPYPFGFMYDAVLNQWFQLPNVPYSIFYGAGVSDGTNFWITSGQDINFAYSLNHYRLEPCPEPAPRLGYAQHTTTDTCATGGAGDDDGFVDPGESFTIEVTVGNFGTAEAPDVTAVLTTTTPGVTVTQGTASYGSIADHTGGVNTPLFEVDVDITVPCGTKIPFDLELTSGSDVWVLHFAQYVGALEAPVDVLPVETFDGVGAGSLPTGWSSVIVDNPVSPEDPAWSTATASVNPAGITPHSGANLAFFNSYDADRGDTARLTYGTPLDLSSYAWAGLRFWIYHENQWTNDDTVQVQVSTDGTTWVDVGEPIHRHGLPAGWTLHTVDLSDYQLLPALHVGILGVGDYGNDIHIDDVSVIGRTATCHVCCPEITLSPTTLPGGLVGSAYDQTVTADGGTPDYVYTISGGSLPAGVTLDSSTGQLSGTLTSEGSYTFTILATDDLGCTGDQEYTVQVCPAITVTTPPAGALTAGTVGAAYATAAFTVSGGTGPYGFAVTSGALPTGLTVDSAGIHGTPTQGGDFTFTITVTDANGCTGTVDYTLHIACPTFTFDPVAGDLADGTAGVVYTPVDVNVSGGLGGYTFEVTGAGALPTGLELASDTGVISGTPTVTGVFTFDVTATDDADCQGTATYTIEVLCPTITLDPVAGSLVGGQVGNPYAGVTITQTGGVGTITWSITAGALPDGLTLGSDTGVVGGTPTTVGSFDFTVTATDANLCTGSAAYTILIATSLEAMGNRVDLDNMAGRSSNLNGVFEPGETVAMSPVWTNNASTALTFTGTASDFVSASGTPAITDGTADYGTFDPAETNHPFNQTNEAYLLTIDNPLPRPAVHWDTTIHETLSDGTTRDFVLHVGASFIDVLPTYSMYAFIENIFHNQVTTGYGTEYRPANKVTRSQMAIFIARAMAGGDLNVPAEGDVGAFHYVCGDSGTSMFVDVPATSSYCPHVHYLAAQNVTMGCVTGPPAQYCPTGLVSRGQMSMFIARAIVGGEEFVPESFFDPVSGRGYNCDPDPLNSSIHFEDVPAGASYCPHAHYLWATFVIDGCDATPPLFCPASKTNRGQMAKFLANAFNLHLYE